MEERRRHSLMAFPCNPLEQDLKTSGCLVRGRARRRGHRRAKDMPISHQGLVVAETSLGLESASPSITRH